MNKLLIVFLLWSISVEVLADTKVNTTYDVDKAWVDDQHLYVLYEKVLTKVYYSMLNINGTIVGEKRSFHLTRFEKMKLGETTSLEGGEPLVEDEHYLNISYYLDQEISVREKNGTTTLVINGKQTQFHCDYRTWVNDAVPVRLDQKIFYCGYLFSRANGQLDKLPKSVESEIQLIRGKTPWGQQYPLMYIAVDGYLLIRSIQADAADILKVQVNNMGTERIARPSFGNGSYRVMGNAVANSTDSFVFGDGNAPAVVSLCSSTCEKISTTPAYRYLVVDSPSKVAYFIHQNLFTSPEIKIEVVKH